MLVKLTVSICHLRIGADQDTIGRVPEDAEANAALIDRFYGAFAGRDHEAMAACYVPDARFTDPVFRDLEGDEVRAMWQMLCERGRDLELSHSDVHTEGDRGSARWVADYTFSGTGRPVHNEIEASFRFRDGLIAEHTDSFDLWLWARQALGTTGLLLGWSPPVPNQIRGQARDNLAEFIAGGESTDAGPVA
jgi:ketosteroid isomerase-like protein